MLSELKKDIIEYIQKNIDSQSKINKFICCFIANWFLDMFNINRTKRSNEQGLRISRACSCPIKGRECSHSR